MNGTGGSFDAGVEIGTSGIGKDDIGSIKFDVVGTSNLTFADFLNASFGIRVTSVGLDGNRDGTSQTGKVARPLFEDHLLKRRERPSPR